jgi:hypothetical protein
MFFYSPAPGLIPHLDEIISGAVGGVGTPVNPVDPVDPEPVTAYAINVNNKAETILSSEEEAVEVLKELEEYYRKFVTTEDKTATISSYAYEEDVEIVEITVQANEIKKKQAAMQILKSSVNVIMKGTRETTEEIDFKTTTRQDPTINIYEKREHQAGEKGARTITYSYVAKNGIFSEKEMLKETVTKSPRDQIILEGTKPTPQYPQPLSNSFSGWYKIQNHLNSNKALTTNAYATSDEGTKMEPGRGVQAAPPQRGTYLEVFSLERLSGHSYSIRYSYSYSGAYYLGIGSGSTPRVQSTTQRTTWYFFDTGEGDYVISNSVSITVGQSLVITSISSLNYSEVNLQRYDPNNKLQRWVLNRDPYF